MIKVINDWDTKKTYQIGDLVKFDSKIYMAKKVNTNILPVIRIILSNKFMTKSNTQLIADLLSIYEANENLYVDNNYTWIEL